MALRQCASHGAPRATRIEIENSKPIIASADRVQAGSACPAILMTLRSGELVFAAISMRWRPVPGTNEFGKHQFAATTRRPSRRAGRDAGYRNPAFSRMIVPRLRFSFSWSFATSLMLPRKSPARLSRSARFSASLTIFAS